MCCLAKEKDLADHARYGMLFQITLLPIWKNGRNSAVIRMPCRAENALKSDRMGCGKLVGWTTLRTKGVACCHRRKLSGVARETPPSVSGRDKIL